MNAPVMNSPSSNQGVPSQGQSDLNSNLNSSLPSLDQIATDHLPAGANPRPAPPAPAAPAAPFAPPAPGQEPPAPGQEPPKENRLQDFQQLSKDQREIYKLKHELAQERASLKTDREQYTKDKDGIDEHIRKMMGLEENETPTENQQVDMADLKKTLREEILGEVEANRVAREDENQVENSVTEYKQDISKFLDDNVQNFPLSKGFASQDQIFGVIEQQYQADAQAYGHERAAEMMMSTEDAAKSVETNLANEIKQVLQFEGVREFVIREANLVRANGGQPPVNHEQPVNTAPGTLNNGQFVQNSQPQNSGNTHAMTDEQAFENALSLVPSDALKR